MRVFPRWCLPRQCAPWRRSSASGAAIRRLGASASARAPSSLLERELAERAQQSLLSGRGPPEQADLWRASTALGRAGGNILPSAVRVATSSAPVEQAAKVSADVALQLGLLPEEARSLETATCLPDWSGSEVTESTDDGPVRVQPCWRRDDVEEAGQLKARLLGAGLAVSAGRLHCCAGLYTAGVEYKPPTKARLPPENCVEVDGRVFSVIPPRHPSDSVVRFDTMDIWYTLPAGWAIVDVSEDVELFNATVAQGAIGAHSWGTDLLLVRRGSRWVPYRTAVWGHRAGQRASSAVDFFDTDVAERRCVFRTWQARLLIERIPVETLRRRWIEYVDLEAPFRWAQELGIPAANKPALPESEHMSIDDRVRRLAKPQAPPSIDAVLHSIAPRQEEPFREEPELHGADFYNEEEFDNRD